MSQIEMSAPLSIFDSGGRLANYGWARSPLFSYDSPETLRPVHRLYASDRYIIFSQTHLVSLEILNDGYFCSAGISVVSLLDNQRSSQIYSSFFPPVIPPDSAESGIARVFRKGILLEFIPMEGGSRIIKVDMIRFGRRRHLRGAIVLTPPPKGESLVTHTPLGVENRSFMLSRNSPWYIAEGVMQFGNVELVFTKGNAWGIFDWNRGRRPHFDVHYWASASGMVDTRHGAFNVGYGQGDANRGTENAFFLDGRIHKLDQVTFHIPPNDWTSPWRFTSNDQRLEMTFVPHQERTEKRRILLHTLNRRQVFGFFSGKTLLDTGETLEFKDLTGFAERRKARF